MCSSAQVTFQLHNYLVLGVDLPLQTTLVLPQPLSAKMFKYDELNSYSVVAQSRL